MFLVKETNFNDYVDLNGQCMMLASEYPELFSYKYGFMSDEVSDDDYGRKGVTFYKFGIKSLNGSFLYLIGFHDGGVSEGIAFIDSFWDKLGVWFLDSKETLDSLDVDPSLKGEVFWLLSVQKVLAYRAYRTTREFKKYSCSELEVLVKQDISFDSKIAVLGSEWDLEKLVSLDGLSTEYIFAYVDADFVKNSLTQSFGFHVLKIDGLF